MNFEFMMDIEPLIQVYKTCQNAEQLAKTMPELSMTASRKSAEIMPK